MGKEGWFTVYFMVTLRLKDSSIYQGFTTNTLKCPIVNVFSLSKQKQRKIILKSRIFHHSFSFSGQIYIFQIFILILHHCIHAFLLSIFIQCCDVYVMRLHGNFSNSETSHHRHKTRRRRGRRRGRWGRGRRSEMVSSHQTSESVSI